MGTFKNLSQQIQDTGRSKKGLDGLPFELTIDSNSEIAKFMRSKDTDRVEQFNKEVQNWATSVAAKLKTNVKSLIKNDISLSSSIKSKVYYDTRYYREANRVGFSFRREGIYVHRGAGKGQGGFKGGSKWTDRYGKLRTTDPKSFGKMGSGNRLPVEWFNPVVTQELNDLVNIVSKYCSDLQIDATRIFISD